MAIGRTWQESVQKALRGLETGLDGFSLPLSWETLPDDKVKYLLRVPTPDRMVVIKQVRVKRIRAAPTIVGRTRLQVPRLVNVLLVVPKLETGCYQNYHYVRISQRQQLQVVARATDVW